MKATIITTEDLRQCDGRNYNAQVWESNIDRMLKGYKDVVFYIVPKGDGYDYDRYFVEYTLPEGLRLFDSFGYGGGISNGGFYRLDKNPITADGLNHRDLNNMIEAGNIDDAKKLYADLENTTTFKISYGKFHDQESDTMVLIGTSKQARAWMSERSAKYGVTFTKG
jgi:hypothetical protein